MSFKGCHAEKRLWCLHHGSLVCATSMVSIAPAVNAYCRVPITQYTDNKKQTQRFSCDWYENPPLPQNALTDGFARPCFWPNSD